LVADGAISQWRESTNVETRCISSKRMGLLASQLMVGSAQIKRIWANMGMNSSLETTKSSPIG
jgi:hypothetical protein